MIHGRVKSNDVADFALCERVMVVSTGPRLLRGRGRSRGGVLLRPRQFGHEDEPYLRSRGRRVPGHRRQSKFLHLFGW